MVSKEQRRHGGGMVYDSETISDYTLAIDGLAGWLEGERGWEGEGRGRRWGWRDTIVERDVSFFSS